MACLFCAELLSSRSIAVPCTSQIELKGMLQDQIAELRTSPEEVDIDAARQKVRNLALLLKAAGIEGSLVERAERAVSAAERAKIEANAKVISDSVERFTNALIDPISLGIPMVKALMPEGGTGSIPAPGVRRKKTRSNLEVYQSYLALKEAREAAQVELQRLRDRNMWQRVWEGLVFERHLHGDW